MKPLQYHTSTLKKLPTKFQRSLTELFSMHQETMQIILQKEDTNSGKISSSLVENLMDFESYLKLHQNQLEVDWKTNKIKVTKDHSLTLHITDIILLLHILLHELILTYFGPEPSKKIDKEINGSCKACFAYFQLSYPNIFFSLHESRENILEGKELIADVLFRHFIEMFESAVLVLVDEEYYGLIRETPEDDITSSIRWNKIKPSAVRYRLNKHIDKNFNEEDFNKCIKIVRDTLYRNNSKSLHADFHTIFASNFKSNHISGEKYFNPYGYDKSKTGVYFTNFIAYNYNMIFVLFSAFISHHHLPFKYFGKLGKEIGVTFKYFEDLMKIYMGHIVDKEKTGDV